MKSDQINNQVQIDPEHYNDGYTDVRNISEFCMMVFTNNDGKTKVVGYDDNFFSTLDLLKAFREISKPVHEDDEEELEQAIDGFKKWMIDTGANPEEWED